MFEIPKARQALAALFIGPLLFASTLMIHSELAALPIALFFTFLVIRFKSLGMLWGGLLIVGYGIYSTITAERPLFEAVYNASLILSLFITALTLDDAAQKMIDESYLFADMEDKIDELERGSKISKETAEKEISALKQEVTALSEDCDLLRNLENTIGIESDKLAEQNRSLVAESLEHHRKIVYLEQSVQGFSEELGRLRELEEMSKKRVDELNTLRTEVFQLKQVKREAPQAIEVQDDKLVELEQEKREAKASYDSMLSEYNTLKKSLEKLVAKKARSEEEEALYQRQRQEFEMRKQPLHQARLELIQMERELFILKKTTHSVQAHPNATSETSLPNATP